MTVDTFETVLTLIQEEPILYRAYWYSVGSGYKSAFAVFHTKAEDDIATRADIEDYICLYRRGKWTIYGKEFLKVEKQE